MMSSSVTKLAESLLQELEAQRTQINRIDLWYRGQNERAILPISNPTKEHRQLLDRSRTPYLGLVVTAVAQQLYVEGYRLPSQPDNALSWSAWQANRMDARQIALHRGALAHGLSFATVVPGELPLTGEEMPCIGTASARKMYAEYADPASDEWPMHALQCDVSRDNLAIKLYDENAVHNLSAPKGGGTVTYIDYTEHGAGVPPVVRYTNMLDLDGRTTGEVLPFIPLARRIDQDTFDRLIVQRYGAWKVRYIAGMVEPETPEAARAAEVQLRVQDLLVSESPDTKFGTLDATDLAGFIAAREADLKDLAAVTQTPPHQLVGSISNLSAEALAAAEASLTRKTVERQHTLGESHESLHRLCSLYMGDDEGAADHSSEVRWRDMESRSMAQVADALGKLATMLQVPVQMLWSQIPGWTDQDVELAKQQLAENEQNVMAGLLQAAAKQTTPPPGVPVPA